MEKGTILVADDKRENRQLLWAILVPEGYEVIEACDGTEVLQILQERPVDMVLLDVMMPQLDGIETCRKIRRELKMITLPVIFVTALSDRLSRIRGQSAGGDDFLSKPIDEVELLVRVRNLMRAKAYHDLQRAHRVQAEAELEALRNQLVHVERLATLGTLAGGVGHELNNILTVFLGTLHFLRVAAGHGQAPRSEDLDQLERVARHIGTHAHHLLSLGRPGPDYAEEVNLSEVVRNTLAMLEASGRIRGIDTQALLPEAPIPVRVNRTRIEQVLVNLIANAADAMPEDRTGARITVSLARDPSGRIRCAVGDNGAGIPAEHLEDIFGAYFTTKPAEKGTGLGLPVVKRIVEQYGGSIEVQSEPGRGSTFTFDIPGSDGT